METTRGGSSGNLRTLAFLEPRGIVTKSRARISNHASDSLPALLLLVSRLLLRLPPPSSFPLRWEPYTNVDTMATVGHSNLLDLPPEMLALIADHTNGVDDLAAMSLVCRRLRNGVLLSHQYTVIEEIISATAGDLCLRKKLLYCRPQLVKYACKQGMLRCLRALNLSYDEVISLRCIPAACTCDHVDVLRYLHTTYDLTADDARRDRNWALEVAARHGSVRAIKYLHTHFGLTADDARANESFPLRIAAQGGHAKTVEYLNTGYGLTAEDARIKENNSLRLASREGHIDVVKYLHVGYGLTTDDARSNDNYCLRLSAKGGHVAVVRYLHVCFGLTEDDALAVIRYHPDFVGLNAEENELLREEFDLVPI
eukprot:TRINITY_DN10774_c0_g1_i1.p1 TRINITY_DN10774_c0_g1~~TRINITY_DN10774_c0_g1_i1.p1  ORF type:complete len:370 (+),score=57.93 TRINITY_DN10774_c0_g1_i1:208-1317(+)